MVDAFKTLEPPQIYTSGYYLYSANIDKYVYVSTDGVCSIPFMANNIKSYTHFAKLSETHIPIIKSKCILYSQDIIEGKAGYDIFNDIIIEEDFDGPITIIGEEENRFRWISSAYIFTSEINNDELERISYIIRPYSNVRLIGTSKWRTVFDNLKLVIITWEINKEDW